MGSASERRRYNVTSSLIGWAIAQIVEFSDRNADCSALAEFNDPFNLEEDQDQAKVQRIYASFSFFLLEY